MMKTKNVLIIIISGLLCVYSILGLNGNSCAQPLTGKCGDGICDDFEKAHPDACPGIAFRGKKMAWRRGKILLLGFIRRFPMK